MAWLAMSDPISVVGLDGFGLPPRGLAPCRLEAGLPGTAPLLLRCIGGLTPRGLYPVPRGLVERGLPAFIAALAIIFPTSCAVGLLLLPLPCPWGLPLLRPPSPAAPTPRAQVPERGAGGGMLGGLLSRMLRLATRGVGGRATPVLLLPKVLAEFR